MTREEPSEDVLRRVLPLVVCRLEAKFAVLCVNVCKSWGCELEEQGFCVRTVQLCSALAQNGDFERIQRKLKLRRRTTRKGRARRAELVDANAFLQNSWGPSWGSLRGWGGGLHEWLQAASQEPDTSFLSRGAASTAQSLGLALIRWVGKPQGRYPGVFSLAGHEKELSCIAFAPDGTRILTGSWDGLVKIWNAANGEVSSFVGVIRGWW